MRPTRRPGVSVAYGIRRVARMLALLALFANQALLPTIHFAEGRFLAAQPAVAHEAQAGHSHHHHQPSDRKPDSDEHQVCHFCRLLGVALPLPPSTLLASGVAPVLVNWTVTDISGAPKPHFQTGRQVRAPPAIS